MNEPGVTVIRNRCIRCRAPIRVPADVVPRITVYLGDGRTLRGFDCEQCEEHRQHMNACKATVHVERWA